MRRKIAVIFTAITIVIGIAALGWHFQGQYVLKNITTNIAQQISTVLGVPVTVGSMVITSASSLTLHQLEIDDNEGVPILISDQVDVNFSLWKLLTGQKTAVEIIQEIHLLAPHLFATKGGDGKWNVAQLLKENVPGQPALHSRIIVDQGLVTLALPQGTWLIDDLAGEIGLEQEVAITLDLTGKVGGNSFNVSGLVNDGGTHRLQVTAANVDLPQFLPLIDGNSQLQGIKVLGGQLADVTLVVVSQQDQPLLFSGESELHDVGVKLNDRAIEHLNGFVTFTQDRLDFYQTAGTLSEQPFTVSGQIYLNTSEPVVDLSLTAAKVDIAALPFEAQATGQVGADVHVSGPVSNPLVEGTVTADNFTVGGYMIDHGQAWIHFIDQQLQFKNLSATLLGGTAAADGQINLKDRTLAIHGSGRHIDSSALASAAGNVAVSGYSDFDVQVDGPLNLSQAAVTAQVAIAEGSLQNVAFQNFKAAFSKTAAGNVTVDSISANIDGGTISAQGSVSQGTIDLSVLAQQIDAATLAAFFTDMPVAGRITLDGQVTGSLENPQLAAQISAEQGQVLQQPFDSLTGAIVATKQQILLKNIQTTYSRTLMDDASASDFRTPLAVTTQNINGTIQLEGDQAVNLTVQIQAARAEDLARLLAPGEDLTGNVNADVIITGPLRQIDAQAAINLTDGSYRGYLIRRAEALVKRSQGVTRVDKLSVHALPATLELTGTIDSNQQMNFAVDIKNIRLQRLGLKLPYPVLGRADFSGQLTGTPDHPIFEGQLLAKTLTIKGQEITDISGHVLLDGQDLRIPDLEFHQGQGMVQLSGGMNLSAETVSGTVELTNGSVSRLLPIFDVAPDTLTGQIDGQIRINGSLDNPTVFLNGKLTGGTIKHYPLDTVDLDVEMTNHVVSINNFTAKQGTGNLVMTGSADLQGPLHLNVFGNGIDSGILPAWFDIKLPVHGGAIISVEVTGDVHTPQAAISVGVQNGTIDSEKFDSLTGSFIVTNKLLDINQITLTKDKFVVSATGTIPLQTLTQQQSLDAPFNFPTHFSPISGRLIGNDEIDVKVMLDQADLSVLPLLSRHITWASGLTKGSLVINGTLNQPQLYGELSVSDGKVKFASLKTPVDHLALDIQLKGDKIIVNSFHGQMGKGNFSLSGSVGLLGRQLADYDLTMQFNQLDIKHINFDGPVSGGLKLTSVAGTPVLSGKLLLENDTIDIPALPDFTAGSFDLGLNVDVVAGKNLRFYNSFMYDFIVTGQVNFGGNLQKITPSGKFIVTHGQITYFTAPFKIQSGSAEFSGHGGLMPMIKLESQFQLQQTTVMLAINGLPSNMDFKLTANPAMSQQQILSLLTLRNRYFERQTTGGNDSALSRDQVDSLFNASLESQLFGPVENSLRSFFGVDDFHIVHGYDTPLGAPNNALATESVYNLEINKYFTDRMSMNYSMGIDHSSQKIGLRYDFNQRYSVGTSLDSRHGFSVDALAKYQF